MTRSFSPRALRRYVALTAAGSLGVAGGAVLTARGWVRRHSRGRVLDVGRAAHAEWAVVLGAGVRPDETPTNTLRYRLDRAVELYRAGKCDRILVTGGVRPGADEVSVMTQYLVRRWVPEHCIETDPWGNNTFNSAQRAAHVYGIGRALVVTQRFHIERAVALFRAAGIDAVGVADDEGRRERWTWCKGTVRELASNVKAMSDVLTRRPYLSPETGPAAPGENQPTHREEP